MADSEEDEATDSEAPSSPWRAWAKGLVFCAVMGGAYGAAIGSITITTDGAVKLIGITAGIMAVICALPGAWYGFFFGYMNRLRFGRLFVGAVAAAFGALLGGFLGIAVTTPLGAIIGAVGGWFVGQSMSRQGYSFRNGLLGVILGACIGAVVLALRRNQAVALPGAMWGLGIGAVSGPVLLLIFVGTVLSLPKTGGDGGNWFDEAFRR